MCPGGFPSRSSSPEVVPMDGYANVTLVRRKDPT